MSIGMTEAQPRNSDRFDLSSPAGWAMLYFALAVIILSILFLGA